MSKEVFESSTIISRGGWDSNRNWLELNENNTGVGAQLINYEPSLYGGYRRIDGFTTLEATDSGQVDSAGAEGKILGVFIYDNQILCARKQKSGATYSFYKYVSGGAWSEYATGLSHVSTGVNRIRYATFNFDGTEKIIFVDGVNKALLFDGATWEFIDSAATGANYANAGGAMALANPSFVGVFENHIFVGGSSTDGGNIIAHSSPNAEYDWVEANGAGQISASMEATQIMPFRESLYVFGFEEIKKILKDGTDFVIKDVATKIGCIAPDSVIELNGDLIFLAEDGFRPIAATERIGDIELATISKTIQSDVRSLVRSTIGSDIVAVPVPSKSQFRTFFTGSSSVETTAPGILGALVNRQGQSQWEFSKLQGIKVACATHGHFGTVATETIIHGTYDGKVMIQESGSSFNGSNIFSQYTTPYLHLGNPSLRKTIYELTVFARPEGTVNIDVGITFDWGITGRINPTDYPIGSTETGSTYGLSLYGTGTFGGATYPVMITNVQGSGKSFNVSFVNTSTEVSWTIMGFIVLYKEHGFK